MSEVLSAKRPTDVTERRFTPETIYALQSVATAASGVTVDKAEVDGDDVVLTLSAGTAGVTGFVTLTVTTSHETLEYKLTIPIIASDAQIANTVRDYCTFALRRAVGLSGTADAVELDDAIAILSAMIPEWRAMGADIAAPMPITANTVIYCPDWAVSGLRYNLLVLCAPVYGYEPSAAEMLAARRGLQVVKAKGLRDDRENEFF